MSARTLRRGRRALAGALVLLLTVGCSSVAERATEAAIEAAAGGSGADVDIERGGERITIEGDGGSMTVGVGDLPDAVRDAFALPDDLEITSGTTMVDSGNTLAGITAFVPRSDLEGLLAELTAAIAAAGWQTTMSMEGGEGVRIIAAERGDESLNLGITPSVSGEGFDLTISVLTNQG
jgi:hypothetical protein